MTEVLEQPAIKQEHRQDKISDMAATQTAKNTHKKNVMRRKLPADFTPASLEQVLSYRNEDVIDGFLLAFDMTREEADEIFIEMLRWLWYTQQETTQGFRSIDDATLVIDEMWHTFILYTPFYTKFCLQHFGQYIHHMPTLNKDREENKTKTRKERLLEKRNQMNTMFDVLGKEVFIKWYHEYPAKYPKQRLLKLRKK